jgi:hypothetical protein
MIRLSPLTILVAATAVPDAAITRARIDTTIGAEGRRPSRCERRTPTFAGTLRLSIDRSLPGHTAQLAVWNRAAGESSLMHRQGNHPPDQHEVSKLDVVVAFPRGATPNITGAGSTCKGQQLRITRYPRKFVSVTRLRLWLKVSPAGVAESTRECGSHDMGGRARSRPSRQGVVGVATWMTSGGLAGAFTPIPGPPARPLASMSDLIRAVAGRVQGTTGTVRFDIQCDATCDAARRSASLGAPLPDRGVAPSAGAWAHRASRDRSPAR